MPLMRTQTGQQRRKQISCVHQRKKLAGWSLCIMLLLVATGRAITIACQYWRLVAWLHAGLHCRLGHKHTHEHAHAHAVTSRRLGPTRVNAAVNGQQLSACNNTHTALVQTNTTFVYRSICIQTPVAVNMVCSNLLPTLLAPPHAGC